VRHAARSVFRGLPNPLQAGRYHSLAAEAGGFPDVLEVLARTEDGEVMGVRVRDSRTVGIQFHPESVLTPDGPQLLKNFLAEDDPC
jgi:anthranilate/para-aminobenzoate synthase component II